MNVIELEAYEGRTAITLGTRIDWYEERVWLTLPPTRAFDATQTFLYTREEYLNGIMEWA